jgi:hypothetical protein
MKTPSLEKIFYIACLVAALSALYTRVWIYPANQIHKDIKESDQMMPDSPKDTILIHYHERRPYYISNGRQVTGLCADPINLIFKKAGIDVIWEKTPAKRQLEILKRNTRC